jgi:hypothetical protein
MEVRLLVTKMAVSIATSSDSVSSSGKRFISIPQDTDQYWGSLIPLSIGYWGLFHMVKAFNNWLPSSAWIKKACCYAPVYWYIFMTWALIKTGIIL